MQEKVNEFIKMDASDTVKGEIAGLLKSISILEKEYIRICKENGIDSTDLMIHVWRNNE